MRGYLTSGASDNFQLSPKVTTIGRDACNNLVIKTASIDGQHAVIDYSEPSECFTLQDLNSAQGTFVNDYRLQNASVRLSSGDLVRFGGSPIVYKFSTDGQPQRSCWMSQNDTSATTTITTPLPPTHPRPSSHTGALSTINGQLVWPAVDMAGSKATPRFKSGIRSRTQSAGGLNTDRRLSVTFAGAGITSNLQCCPIHTINGSGDVGCHCHLNNTVQSQNDLQTQLRLLNEELRRLMAYETVCKAKDEQVARLREEIASLQRRLRHAEVGLCDLSHSDVQQKLLQLEKEVSTKKVDAQNLRIQLSRMRPEPPGGRSPYHVRCTDGTHSSGYSRSRSSSACTACRGIDIPRLKQELEAFQNEKTENSPTVVQLQQDMANKDITISRMTKNIEELKQAVQAKDSVIAGMKANLKKSEESEVAEELVEIALLKSKLHSVENQNTMLTAQIAKLRQEASAMKATEESNNLSIRRLKTDLQAAVGKHNDIERAERQVRVSQEQINKRLEKLRGAVIQTAFSSPDAKVPNKALSDDELIIALRSSIEEKMEMLKKIQSLSEKKLIENAKKLRQQLSDSVTRLSEGTLRLSGVDVVVDSIRGISLDDECLSELRDVVYDALILLRKSNRDLNETMDKCGVSLENSEHGAGKHILDMYSELQQSLKERNQLRADFDVINEVVSRMNLEHDAAISKLKTELEQQFTELAAIQKQESETIHAREVEEVTSKVKEERHKTQELEKVIEHLKTSLLAKKKKCDELTELNSAANQTAEICKQTEDKLREKIVQLQSDFETKKQGCESQLRELREQIKQHSLTICDLEEKLRQTISKYEEQVNKNKEQMNEINRFNQEISDLTDKASRALNPPLPKLIIQRPAVDIFAMEQTMIALQRQNTDYENQLQQQHDVIVALRRDLAAATARLSDLASELSEEEKRGKEACLETIRRQEAELSRANQQLSMLSGIIEHHEEEIRSYKTQLSERTEELQRCKEKLSKNKGNAVKSLERESMEKPNNDKDYFYLKVGQSQCHCHHIGELCNVGEQCVAEQHRQVIERQTDALKELRTRLRSEGKYNQALDSAKMTPDQTMQKVVQIKRDFDNLRGGDTQHTMSPDPVKKSTPRARPSSDLADASTSQSLELSENTYIELVRRLSSSLETSIPPGCLQSLVNLGSEDCDSLLAERGVASDLLTNAVETLKKRLKRREELLRSCDGDLAKIREAQESASPTIGSQVEEIVVGLCRLEVELQEKEIMKDFNNQRT